MPNIWSVSLLNTLSDMRPRFTITPCFLSSFKVFPRCFLRLNRSNPWKLDVYINHLAPFIPLYIKNDHPFRRLGGLLGVSLLRGSAFVRLFIYIGEKDAGDLWGNWCAPGILCWYPTPLPPTKTKTFFSCEWVGVGVVRVGWISYAPMYNYNGMIPPWFSPLPLIFQRLQPVI